MDFKRINTRRFEESIGFSNGAFASQYKHKKSIGVDKVERVLEVYPDINPVWLLTGKGDMILPVRKSGRGRKPAAQSVDNSQENTSDEYKDKYIRQLERDNELLRFDLKQKHEIIQSFLSGTVVKNNQ
jgi:hypothetical protein